MAPELAKIKGISFNGDVDGEKPKPTYMDNRKNKPMSKKLSSNIAACSAEMTEILSWEAKIQENRAGLILGNYYIA